MTARTRQHPWRASALIWASCVALVLLVQVLLAQAGGNRVGWAGAVALALIIPSIRIAGVPRDCAKEAGGLVAASGRNTQRRLSPVLMPRPDDAEAAKI